jgi:hypothetical protein
MQLNDLKNKLIDILENKMDRASKVKICQDIIWNSEIDNLSEVQNEILSDLAHDLDFYEPNPDWRSQDSSFYGEDRLECEIREALSKLDHK